MRVYEAIVKGLEGVGVDAAFGGAGENAASLMLALKHSTKIKPIIVRHEQAASFMACGYAIYSNRLGFCFATAGPGAFNLFSGLAVAMSDSYPVLAISGYASLDWQGRGSLNETSGINRTPDSRAMFAATTKKSYLLTDIADTCDVRGSGQRRVRGTPRPGAYPRPGEPHRARRQGRQLPRHPARRGAGPARPGTSRGDRRRPGQRDRPGGAHRRARRVRC